MKICGRAGRPRFEDVYTEHHHQCLDRNGYLCASTTPFTLFDIDPDPCCRLTAAAAIWPTV